MSDDPIISSGGSSAWLRGLLIALPFFLFLYYAKVSSEKIKELKEQIQLTPITTEPLIPPPSQIIIQSDTALTNMMNNLTYENKTLQQIVDSLQKQITLITP